MGNSKKWLRAFSAGLALASLLPVLGCDAGNSVQSTGVLDLAREPEHIYKEIRDGLLVDAEVDIPGDRTIPKVYVAESIAIDESFINAFLAAFKDAPGALEITPMENDLTLYRMDKTENDFQLSAAVNKNINFDSAWIGYHSNREDYEWQRYYVDYRAPEDRALYADFGSMMYTEPRSFAFASPEEAAQEICDILAGLGIPNLRLCDTLYVDHETVKEFAESGWIAEHYEAFEESALPEHTWTEADDFYYFTFSFDIAGIPMYAMPFVTSTFSYPGGNVWAKYGAEGVIDLGCYYPRMAGAVVEEPPSILSAEDALAVAVRKKEDVITGHEQIIDSIALRYYCVQEGDRWLLTPIWVVSVLEKNYYAVENGNKDKYDRVIIDAITGKEI